MDRHIFLILTTDPWYGDIIIYLQTLRVPPHLLQDEHRRLQHNSKNYLMIDEILYRRGVASIFLCCLTHDEDEIVLIDFHGGSCDGHLSRLATAQKILRVDYYWSSIFKYCVNAVKRCHPC